MKLVVGIGNPGKEYAGTRHNVGFEVVERVAARHSVELSRDKRLRARIGRLRLPGEDVMLIEPLSYVNLTGPVVARIVREREVELDDLLVVVDDFHLDLGQVRMRVRGSAGGHNGLRSIIAQLGSDEFPRLRIGIGEAPPGTATDFVLTRFRPSERERIAEAYLNATDCVEDWWSLGAVEAMNRHNA